MTFEEVDGDLSELILTSTGEIADVSFNFTFPVQISYCYEQFVIFEIKC